MLKGRSGEGFWAEDAEPGLGGRLVSRAGLRWGVRVSLLLSISVSYQPGRPGDLKLSTDPELDSLRPLVSDKFLTC